MSFMQLNALAPAWVVLVGIAPLHAPDHAPVALGARLHAVRPVVQIEDPGQGSPASPAVDGRTNPDAIPDFVAYRQLVMVLALPDAPLPSDVARQQAFLDRIALTPSDRGAVAASLVGVRSVLDQRARVLNSKTLNSGERAAYVNLRTQTLNAAVSTLKSSLSPEGRVRLQAYIKLMKRKIKIYGSVVSEP